MHITKLAPRESPKYFSTNRPFWGWLFQVTLPLIGAIPWKWQVFALILRWLTGISVWILLKNFMAQTINSGNVDSYS